MSICENCRLPVGAEPTKSLCLCSPCTMLVKNEPSVRVSPFKRDDLELVLAWRSNPEIYRYFRKQDDPLHWGEHVSWFNSRASERYDFVIHYNERRVGIVSIGQDDVVGIYLGDFSAHGQGIATKTLNWICDRFECRKPLFAEVHEDNDASKQLFRRCGFRQVNQDGKWLKYVCDQ